MLFLHVESYVYGTMNISLRYREYMFMVLGMYVYGTKNIKYIGYGKLLSTETAGRHEGRRKRGVSKDADVHAA